MGGWLYFSFPEAGTTAQAAAKTVALVGGRIHTQTDSGALQGKVVIRDGKIVAVGPDVTVPDDAQRIDVTGYVITPGLIDVRSTLWLTSAAIRESSSDGGLDVLDGVDPHEEDWKEVARQGVTVVYVQPASTGLLGGRGAVLKVGPAESVEELVIKASAGAQATLGAQLAAPVQAAPAQGFGGRRGGQPPVPVEAMQPAPAPTGNSLTRFAQYEQLKRILQGASAGGEGAGSRGGRRDPTRDFLRQVLKGEVPLRLEAHREDDVRNALRLAEELKLHLVLEGVSNPRSAAASIVSQGVPLVLGPFVDLEDSPAARKDRPADWPKALLTPNTRWALGTFSSQSRGSRLLRAHAAAAVARGLESERVLRALTRDAAEILGVGDRLGTIAAGKQADLAVFAGDPLDPSVPVRLVLSAGKVVYESKAEPVASPVGFGGTVVPPVQTTDRRDDGPTSPLPARLPKKYALKTRRLLLEDGKVQAGMVLVESGKVSAIGSSVNLGEGTPLYDLGSAVVSPGLVAAHSLLGLARAIDDPAEADASQVRAVDVFDPRQQAIRELMEGGFTSALFAPGSVNVIAGGVGGMRLGVAEPFLGDAGLKFVLATSSRSSSRVAVDAETDDPVVPTGGRRGGGGPARYPGSLAGQVELIEQVLSGKVPPSELYVPNRVRDQIHAERRRVVAPVLERKQIAFFEAHTRAEIDAALRLIARFKLRGVLVAPDEIKPFLTEIKRLEVGIVARPAHGGDYDRRLQALAEAAGAGIPVAFGSGSAQEMRLTAALAMNFGMPREAAWRGLTTAVGSMTTQPAGAGKLAAGAPADLVVWDGPSLDLRSRPLSVIVDGKLVHAVP
jgi:imidazolonepropionase-like amidohydrolase